MVWAEKRYMAGELVEREEHAKAQITSCLVRLIRNLERKGARIHHLAGWSERLKNYFILAMRK